MKANLVFILLLISKLALGQDAFCGIDSFYFRKVFDDAFLKEKSLKAFQKQKIANFIQPRSILIIPVVFHIVYSNEEENICDELIYSQIDKLNEDFSFQNADKVSIPNEFKNLGADTEIQFCLANIDTSGKQTNGITRTKTTQKGIGLSDDLFFREKGGKTAWNTERYLNIWVADLGTKITGFASMPLQTSSYRDGVVLHYKYTGFNKDKYYGLGRVGVHEVGHYLGLTHIWGTKNGCDDDDGIEDTPQQATNYKGCPNYPKQSCGVSSMFMNYMDYVDDPCMVMFSKGQKERMITTLMTSRKSLLNLSECSKIPSSGDIVKIYPNPFSDKMTIEANQNINDVVLFYTIDGRLIATKQMRHTNLLNFCTEELSSGFYILKIANQSFKLIKQN
jgi:Pregnancy-associated plasma protein-A/Secretion system C-terminal sorting domain